MQSDRIGPGIPLGIVKGAGCLHSRYGEWHQRVASFQDAPSVRPDNRVRANCWYHDRPRWPTGSLVGDTDKYLDRRRHSQLEVMDPGSAYVEDARFDSIDDAKKAIRERAKDLNDGRYCTSEEN